MSCLWMCACMCWCSPALRTIRLWLHPQRRMGRKPLILTNNNNQLSVKCAKIQSNVPSALVNPHPWILTLGVGWGLFRKWWSTARPRRPVAPVTTKRFSSRMFGKLKPPLCSLLPYFFTAWYKTSKKVNTRQKQYLMEETLEGYKWKTFIDN